MDRVDCMSPGECHTASWLGTAFQLEFHAFLGNGNKINFQMNEIHFLCPNKGDRKLFTPGLCYSVVFSLVTRYFGWILDIGMVEIW